MSSRWEIIDGHAVLVFDDEKGPEKAAPAPLPAPEVKIERATPAPAPAPAPEPQATGGGEPPRPPIKPPVITVDAEPPEPDPGKPGWAVGRNIQNILGASLARRPTIELGGSADRTPDFAALLRIPANAVTGFGQSVIDLFQRDVPELLGMRTDAPLPTLRDTPPEAEANIAKAVSPQEVVLPRIVSSTGNHPAEELIAGIGQAAVGFGALSGAGVFRAAGSIGTRIGATSAGQAAGRALPNVLKTRAAAEIGKAAAKGAAVDFAAFAPDEGRLTDLIAQLSQESWGTPLEHIVIPALLTEEDDSYAMGRLKNAIEGVPLGMTIDLGIEGLRFLRAEARVIKAKADLDTNIANYEKAGVEFDQATDPVDKEFARQKGASYREYRPVLEEQLTAAKEKRREVRNRWRYVQEKPSDTFHRVVADDWVDRTDAESRAVDVEAETVTADDATFDDAEAVAKAELENVRKENAAQAEEVTQAYDDIEYIDNEIVETSSTLNQSLAESASIERNVEKVSNTDQLPKREREGLVERLQDRQRRVNQTVEWARDALQYLSIRRQVATARLSQPGAVKGGALAVGSQDKLSEVLWQRLAGTPKDLRKQRGQLRSQVLQAQDELDRLEDLRASRSGEDLDLDSDIAVTEASVRKYREQLGEINARLDLFWSFKKKLTEDSGIEDLRTVAEAELKKAQESQARIQANLEQATARLDQREIRKLTRELADAKAKTAASSRLVRRIEVFQQTRLPEGGNRLTNAESNNLVSVIVPLRDPRVEGDAALQALRRGTRHRQRVLSLGAKHNGDPTSFTGATPNEAIILTKLSEARFAVDDVDEQTLLPFGRTVNYVIAKRTWQARQIGLARQEREESRAWLGLAPRGPQRISGLLAPGPEGLPVARFDPMDPLTTEGGLARLDRMSPEYLGETGEMGARAASIKASEYRAAAARVWVEEERLRSTPPTAAPPKEKPVTIDVTAETIPQTPELPSARKTGLAKTAFFAKTEEVTEVSKGAMERYEMNLARLQDQRVAFLVEAQRWQELANRGNIPSLGVASSQTVLGSDNALAVKRLAAVPGNLRERALHRMASRMAEGIWIPNEAALMANIVEGTSTGARKLHAIVALGLQATGNSVVTKPVARFIALSGLTFPGVYGDVATFAGHALRGMYPGPVGEFLGSSHDLAAQFFKGLDFYTTDAINYFLHAAGDAFMDAFPKADLPSLPELPSAFRQISYENPSPVDITADLLARLHDWQIEVQDYVSALTERNMGFLRDLELRRFIEGSQQEFPLLGDVPDPRRFPEALDFHWKNIVPEGMREWSDMIGKELRIKADLGIAAKQGILDQYIRELPLNLFMERQQEAFGAFQANFIEDFGHWLEEWGKNSEGWSEGLDKATDQFKKDGDLEKFIRDGAWRYKASNISFDVTDIKGFGENLLGQFFASDAGRHLGDVSGSLGHFGEHVKELLYRVFEHPFGTKFVKEPPSAEIRELFRELSMQTPPLDDFVNDSLATRFQHFAEWLQDTAMPYLQNIQNDTVIATSIKAQVKDLVDAGVPLDEARKIVADVMNIEIDWVKIAQTPQPGSGLVGVGGVTQISNVTEGFQFLIAEQAQKLFSPSEWGAMFDVSKHLGDVSKHLGDDVGPLARSWATAGEWLNKILYHPLETPDFVKEPRSAEWDEVFRELSMQTPPLDDFVNDNLGTHLSYFLEWWNYEAVPGMFRLSEEVTAGFVMYNEAAQLWLAGWPWDTAWKYVTETVVTELNWMEFFSTPYPGSGVDGITQASNLMQGLSQGIQAVVPGIDPQEIIKNIDFKGVDVSLPEIRLGDVVQGIELPEALQDLDVKGLITDQLRKIKPPEGDALGRRLGTMAVRAALANYVFVPILRKMGVLNAVQGVVRHASYPVQLMGQAAMPWYQPIDPKGLREAAMVRQVQGTKFIEDRLVDIMSAAKAFRNKQRVTLAERELQYLAANEEVGRALMFPEDEFSAFRAVKQGFQGVAGVISDSLSGESDWLVKTSNIFYGAEPATSSRATQEIANDFLLDLIQNKKVSGSSISNWLGLVQQARRSDSIALDAWDALNNATSVVRQEDGIIAVEPRLAPEGIATRLKDLPNQTQTMVGRFGELAQRAPTNVADVRRLYPDEVAIKATEAMADADVRKAENRRAIETRRVGRRAARRIEKLRGQISQFAAETQYLGSRKALEDLEEFHRWIGRGGGDIQEWTKSRQSPLDVKQDLDTWDKVDKMMTQMAGEQNLGRLDTGLESLESTMAQALASLRGRMTADVLASTVRLAQLERHDVAMQKRQGIPPLGLMDILEDTGTTASAKQARKVFLKEFENAPEISRMLFGDDQPTGLMQAAILAARRSGVAISEAFMDTVSFEAASFDIDYGFERTLREAGASFKPLAFFALQQSSGFRDRLRVFAMGADANRLGLALLDKELLENQIKLREDLAAEAIQLDDVNRHLNIENQLKAKKMKLAKLDQQIEKLQESLEKGTPRAKDRELAEAEVLSGMYESNVNQLKAAKQQLQQAQHRVKNLPNVRQQVAGSEKQLEKLNTAIANLKKTLALAGQEKKKQRQTAKLATEAQEQEYDKLAGEVKTLVRQIGELPPVLQAEELAKDAQGVSVTLGSVAKSLTTNMETLDSRLKIIDATKTELAKLTAQERRIQRILRRKMTENLKTRYKGFIGKRAENQAKRDWAQIPKLEERVKYLERKGELILRRIPGNESLGAKYRLELVESLKRLTGKGARAATAIAARRAARQVAKIQLPRTPGKDFFSLLDKSIRTGTRNIPIAKVGPTPIYVARLDLPVVRALRVLADNWTKIPQHVEDFWKSLPGDPREYAQRTEYGSSLLDKLRQGQEFQVELDELGKATKVVADWATGQGFEIRPRRQYEAPTSKAVPEEDPWDVPLTEAELQGQQDFRSQRDADVAELRDALEAEAEAEMDRLRQDADAEIAEAQQEVSDVSAEQNEALETGQELRRPEQGLPASEADEGGKALEAVADVELKETEWRSAFRSKEARFAEAEELRKREQLSSDPEEVKAINKRRAQIELEQGFFENAEETLSDGATLKKLADYARFQLRANRKLELNLQREIDEFMALGETADAADAKLELEEVKGGSEWLEARIEEWDNWSDADATQNVTEVAEAMSDTAPVIQWGELGRPGPLRIEDITVEKAGKPFDDKFVPGRGGSVDVWQDPETKQVFLVNGARRVATAKRDGFQTIQTKFYNAKTLEDAQLLDRATELAVELQPPLSDLSGYVRRSMPSPNQIFQQLIGRELNFLELLQIIQGKVPAALRRRLEQLNRQETVEVEVEVEGEAAKPKPDPEASDPALDGDSIEDQPQALEPEFEDDFTADVDAEDVAGDVEAPEPRPETEAEAPPEPRPETEAEAPPEPRPEVEEPVPFDSAKHQGSVPTEEAPTAETVYEVDPGVVEFSQLIIGETKARITTTSAAASLRKRFPYMSVWNTSTLLGIANEDLTWEETLDAVLDSGVFGRKPINMTESDIRDTAKIIAEAKKQAKPVDYLTSSLSVPTEQALRLLVLDPSDWDALTKEIQKTGIFTDIGEARIAATILRQINFPVPGESVAIGLDREGIKEVLDTMDLVTARDLAEDIIDVFPFATREDVEELSRVLLNEKQMAQGIAEILVEEIDPATGGLTGKQVLQSGERRQFGSILRELTQDLSNEGWKRLREIRVRPGQQPLPLEVLENITLLKIRREGDEFMFLANQASPGITPEQIEDISKIFRAYWGPDGEASTTAQDVNSLVVQLNTRLPGNWQPMVERYKARWKEAPSTIQEFEDFVPRARQLSPGIADEQIQKIYKVLTDAWGGKGKEPHTPETTKKIVDRLNKIAKGDWEFMADRARLQAQFVRGRVPQVGVTDANRYFNEFTDAIDSFLNPESSRDKLSRMAISLPREARRSVLAIVENKADDILRQRARAYLGITTDDAGLALIQQKPELTAAERLAAFKGAKEAFLDPETDERALRGISESLPDNKAREALARDIQAESDYIASRAEEYLGSDRAEPADKPSRDLTPEAARKIFLDSQSKSGELQQTADRLTQEQQQKLLTEIKDVTERRYERARKYLLPDEPTGSVGEQVPTEPGPGRTSDQEFQAVLPIPDPRKMFQNLRGTLEDVQKWGWQAMPWQIQLKLGTLLSFGADTPEGKLAAKVIDPDVADKHAATAAKQREMEMEFQRNEQRLAELFDQTGIDPETGFATVYREKLDLARRVQLEDNPDPEARGRLQELEARSAERVLEALNLRQFQQVLAVGERNMVIRNSLKALEELHRTIDHNQNLSQVGPDAPTPEQLMQMQAMVQELPQDYGLTFFGVTLPQLDQILEQVNKTTRPIHRFLSKALADLYNTIKDFANRLLRRKKKQTAPRKPQGRKTTQERADEILNDPTGRATQQYTQPPGANDSPAPNSPAMAVETDIDLLLEAIQAKQAGLATGAVRLEDLIAESQSNMGSRSGKSKHMAPMPRDQVILQASFADVFDSGAKGALPTYTDAALARETREAIARHGYDSILAAEKLKPIIEQLGRPSLVALRGALLNLDYTTMRTAQAASRVLNLAHASPVKVREEAYESLLGWIHNQQVLNQAYRSTLRGLGQMFRVPSIPRTAPGFTAPGGVNPDIPPSTLGQDPVDVARFLADETIRAANTPASRMLGEKISRKLMAQFNRMARGEKPNFRDAELMQELDELAIIAKDFEVAPELRDSVFDRMADTANMHFEGLMTLRMAALLSSGATTWVNALSGGYRLLTQPIVGTAGAFTRPGSLPEALSSGLRQYVAMGAQLRAATRLFSISFQEGVGLWDPSSMSADALDKMARQAGDGTVTIEPESWSLNQPPLEHFSNRHPALKAGTRAFWQISGLPLRLLASTDTLIKAIGGNANHWVRQYDKGMEIGRNRGLEDKALDEWATKYAEKALARDFRDVLIKQQDGREVRVRAGAMVDPHALAYARNITFTDNLWARPEHRTFEKGLEIAIRRGITTEREQGLFARQYMSANKGRTFPEVIMGHTRPLSAIPQAINKLKTQPGIGPLVTIIAPFVKTPTNIIKSALRFSPAAPMVDTWWRDILSNDKLTRQQAAGEVALGTMAIGGLMFALNQGNVEFTGGGPQEYQSRLKWVNEQQKRPYSWRTKREDGSWGPWNSYRAYEPIATQLGMIADWREMSNSMTVEQQHGAGGTLILDLATRSSTGLLGKNWFQGFEELTTAVERVNREGFGREGRRNPLYRWFTRTAVTFTPMSSMLRRATRTIDPTVRTVQAGTAGEELLNEWRKLVPGWSRDLPPALNTITGEVVTVGGLLGRRWVNEDAPLYYSAAQFSPLSSLDQWQPANDPVLREMGRLHQDGATFTAPSRRRFTLNGRIPQNVMNEREWNLWVTYRTKITLDDGMTLHQALYKTIRSGDYYDASDGTVPTKVVDGVVVERRRSRNQPNEKAELLKGIIKAYDEAADRVWTRQQKDDHTTTRINVNLARYGTAQENLSRVEKLKPATQALLYKEAATLTGNP